MDNTIKEILAVPFVKFHTHAEVNSYFLRILDEYENCVQAESGNRDFAEERIQLKEKLGQLFKHYLKKSNEKHFKNIYRGQDEN